MYDYLIIGSGLFGSTFASLAKEAGKRCLVVEKRNHIGGNIYTEQVEGIHVHRYGAHIFHTSDKVVWVFMNRFCEFNRYINSPLVFSKGNLYNLPFNMNTFYQLWKLRTPQDVLAKIEEQRAVYGFDSPANLEEQALSLVGRDMYELLIKEYTEKQWGMPATQLPAFIIKRLPLRFTYDNNYFNDTYQGIPVGGYTAIPEKMLSGCDVLTNTDFLTDRSCLKALAPKIIYTGTIDSYFDYCFGRLAYRSRTFAHETLSCANYQGNAVINYADAATPYIRVIEHKHFTYGSQPSTVITREYPYGDEVKEPYYPVNNEENMRLLAKYQDLAKGEPNVFFAGRLGEYAYYDMHQVVRKAIDLWTSMPDVDPGLRLI